MGNDRSTAAAQWHAGVVAEERERFDEFANTHGPPTPASRNLFHALGNALACRICQILVVRHWEETHDPSKTAAKRWLYPGCVPIVRRVLLERGWHITDKGCDGSGVNAEGTIWCLIQDPQAEVVRRPELCKVYNPTSDALFHACEQTLGHRAHAG